MGRFDARVEVVELTGSQAIVPHLTDDVRLSALVGARAAATLTEGTTTGFAVARGNTLPFDAQGRRVGA